MSINQPYDTWVSRILQIRPTERITRVRNMALLLHGIFERKSVHVSEVATKIISSAKLLSVTRRLSRFLANPAVRVREWYMLRWPKRCCCRRCAASAKSASCAMVRKWVRDISC